MGKLRVESVVPLVVGVLLLLGSAQLFRSAMAFSARESVNGVVVAIGERRDAQGVAFSTATVEWKDAKGGAHQLDTTDPDRFAFANGQVIELKIDPENPNEASVAGAGNRTYLGFTLGGIGLYFVFVAVRAISRARPVRKPT